MFVAHSPFERLRRALADAPPGAPPIDLSIGSPTHPSPDFVPEVLARHAGEFVAYPPFEGTASFQRAVHDWLDRRYGLEGWFREAGVVLPTSGSRDGLFFSLVTVRDILEKPRPAVLFANPFYQAYPAAAHAIGAEPVPIAAADGIVPDFEAVPEATLDRAIAYYFGAPSNPAGAVATVADWHRLFDRAERHDFFLFADECYSEIYREAAGPPAGALQAARERPDALARLVVFNSLSKRSNLAGMRTGIVAAERELAASLKGLRQQAGPQVPTPLQEVAAAAFDDEAHVAANRRLYDAKFVDAEAALGPLFGPVTPPASFFLWLPVSDDLEFAVRLWREAGVRVLPGRYLGSGEGPANPGHGRVRLALVADAERTRGALARVGEAMDAPALREAAAG
ncbi:aminotransferase class I/II-fold pyridoxal phosphate-dependent enzyme [Acuticoccus sp.]|uniref:aminotransferase class I/II-fold pyridoxal phosphate-dependent enzyme n=1 Tax=Acuticoccus sp. TaxID=1904378 RepID=UPI003B5266CB